MALPPLQMFDHRARYIEVPADITATVDHIVRIQLKINRLQESHRSSLAALEQAVARCPRVSPGAIADLCGSLRDVGSKGSMILNRAVPSDDRPAPAVDHPRLRNGVCVVYVLLRQNVPVYVGRSRQIRNRLKRHLNEGTKLFDRAEVYLVDGPAEAADLEAVLQQQHAPQYNVRIEKRGVA